MGNEANCAVSVGKQKARGRALLETSELIFRGEDGALRLKIPFSSVKSAKAVNGELRLEVPEGLAVFALVVGEFDGDFLAELSSCTKNVTTGKVAGAPDWIFFAAGSVKELSQVSKLAKSLKDRAALWIVYPKGQKQITENNVLTSGRKAGLKDVKVVGFSATCTALKFVIPVEKR